MVFVAFDDCGDLEAYLEINKKPASGGNIGMDAKGVLALNPGCNGYVVEHDKGRGQPEYVLFDKGLSYLTAQGPVPFVETGHQTPQGEVREHHLYGELWGRMLPGSDGEPPSYRVVNQ